MLDSSERARDRQSTDQRRGRCQDLLLGRQATGELLGQADVRAGVSRGACALVLRLILRLVRAAVITIGLMVRVLDGDMTARTEAHHQAIGQPQRRESLGADQENQDEQPVNRHVRVAMSAL